MDSPLELVAGGADEVPVAVDVDRVIGGAVDPVEGHVVAGDATGEIGGRQRLAPGGDPHAPGVEGSVVRREVILDVQGPPTVGELRVEVAESTGPRHLHGAAAGVGNAVVGQAKVVEEDDDVVGVVSLFVV